MGQSYFSQGFGVNRNGMVFARPLRVGFFLRERKIPLIARSKNSTERDSSSCGVKGSDSSDSFGLFGTSLIGLEVGGIEDVVAAQKYISGL